MKKRREMNPEGKRAAVMAAGEKLFASHGYTNTSMADIARAADVAVGTLYRLFPDKPSLLAALHSAMEDRFIAAMKEGWHRKETYAERFQPMLEALFEEADTVREIMPLYTMTRDVIGAANYQPGLRMMNAIEDLYALGVKAGVFRKMPKGLIGPLSHSMVDGGMRALMADPSARRKRQIVQEMTALFQRSFVVS